MTTVVVMVVADGLVIRKVIPKPRAEDGKIPITATADGLAIRKAIPKLPAEDGKTPITAIADGSVIPRAIPKLPGGAGRIQTMATADGLAIQKAIRKPRVRHGKRAMNVTETAVETLAVMVMVEMVTEAVLKETVPATAIMTMIAVGTIVVAETVPKAVLKARAVVPAATMMIAVTAVMAVRAPRPHPGVAIIHPVAEAVTAMKIAAGAPVDVTNYDLVYFETAPSGAVLLCFPCSVTTAMFNVDISMPFYIDSILLKSFIAIAETGSFSRAAEIVGRTQSAVSLQIKKLEEGLNCTLFDRTSRQVTLTEQGNIFLGYARRILELQWEAYSRLNEPDVEGQISLGTPEDFASHYLPNILAAFSRQHPQVQLHVQCDLTLNLMNGFQKGAYDMVLVKRDPEKVKGGTKVWREPLSWVAANGHSLKFPLSLVLSPPPCIYRARALASLDRLRKPWQIVYTSPSLAGTIAAVKAGLGVTVLPANMIPPGLEVLRKLPHLADSEIALMKKEKLSKPAKMLAEHIMHSLGQ
jgi:DNA-binding transcriptional LysR family regulator